MKGEQYWWVALSHELGVPTQRLKQESTYSDFVDHVSYMIEKREEENKREIEREWKERKAVHYYLAQIAYEIAKKFSSKSELLTIEQYLMDFELKTKDEKKPPQQSTPQSSDVEEPIDQESAVQQSKNTLLRALGIKQ